MSHALGSRIRLDVDFRGTHSWDPAEVVLIITAPSGRYIHVTWDLGDDLSPITRLEAARYAFVHIANELGWHSYRWKAKGPVIAMHQGEFEVTVLGDT